MTSGQHPASLPLLSPQRALNAQCSARKPQPVSLLCSFRLALGTQCCGVLLAPQLGLPESAVPAFPFPQGAFLTLHDFIIFCLLFPFLLFSGSWSFNAAVVSCMTLCLPRPRPPAHSFLNQRLNISKAYFWFSTVCSFVINSENVLKGKEKKKSNALSIGA